MDDVVTDEYHISSFTVFLFLFLWSLWRYWRGISSSITLLVLLRARTALSLLKSSRFQLKVLSLHQPEHHK
jgi:hypothetical protein